MNDQKNEIKESIRKRPGMYIGGTGSKGIVNLLKGLITDCINISGLDHYFFHIVINKTDTFEVKIKTALDITGFLDSRNKADREFKHYHLFALEALSTFFQVDKEGDGITSLKFQLDPDIFTENSVDYLELSDEILQLAYLNRNSEFLITDNRGSYLIQNYFYFPEGVRYVYERLRKEALGTPEFEISFDGEYNGCLYQIYLGYRTDWFPPATILSFANNVHTTCGGSLVDGIMDGLVSGCRDYVRNNNLTNHNIRKKKFANGLILVCHVRGEEFRYGGSFKETLEDDKVNSGVKKLMKGMSLEFMKRNKKIADKFLRRFDRMQVTGGMF